MCQTATIDRAASPVFSAIYPKAQDNIYTAAMLLLYIPLK